MSNLKTLMDSTSAISSPESVDGVKHSASPDTPMSKGSGPGPAPVNLSPPQESAKELPMPDTSGPRCSDSSNSANLSTLLANKLKQRLGQGGSMEYSETWKEKATPAGRQFWAHTASGRRTSGSGYTGEPQGWKSPKATEGMGRYSQCNGKKYPGLWLQVDGILQGWPTPQTHDVTTRGNTNADHHHFAHDLSNAALTVPANRGGLQTNPEKAMERRAQGHQLNLDDAATLVPVAGWATPTVPRAHDSDNSAGNGQCKQMDIYKQLLGPRKPASSSLAPTERPAGLALNPNFSMWLMGFGIIWSICGQRALRKKK